MLPPAGLVRSISFAPALLAAVRTGHKTVTRRRIVHPGLQATPARYAFGGLHADEAHFEAVLSSGRAERITCPFGQPGDWLRVVEEPALLLHIGHIRAEPVRAITEAGALAEGVREQLDEQGRPVSAVAAFARLLGSFYPTAWARNEWVWVIEFQLGLSEPAPPAGT